MVEISVSSYSRQDYINIVSFVFKCSIKHRKTIKIQEFVNVLSFQGLTVFYFLVFSRLHMYSSVPNKRADPNKRAGRNFLELLINVQGGMLPNKCAGWKNSQKS